VKSAGQIQSAFSATISGGKLHFIRRFRIAGLFCSIAVLLCEVVSRPYAAMGVCDDAPYILMAQRLANTGHVVYDGWVSPMLGWQLYLGSAFIKLFGFSFTAVRMSTLLVSMALAFVLQRTLVRSGITERNATLGTLALVLSPLYLMLSVTYMTDIFGLFSIVICLYGCLRALQAYTERATIAWLCAAVVGNALCGTSRQIAWLGVLVMVPSTLWLLRDRRRVLVAGGGATLAGFVFVFGCMQWLKHQPYFLPEPLLPHRGQTFNALSSSFHACLDIPLLLLPIAMLFLPEMRKSLRRLVATIAASSVIYILILLALRWKHIDVHPLLEPTVGNWINVYGINSTTSLHGTPAVYLQTWMRVLLTIVVFGSLFGLAVSLLGARGKRVVTDLSPSVSWKQLGMLLGPFSLAYVLILVPRGASDRLVDRYLIELVLVALVCLVRYYQDRISPRLPAALIVLIGLMAIYGITCTHNMFSFYRARVALVAELRAAGIPDTSVDNGWEYNLAVELQHASYLNDSRIKLPANAYVPPPAPPPSICNMAMFDVSPHVHPVYGVSFDPNACYGPAPIAPVQYSRWPYSVPGSLYVVHFLPPAGH
jgi:hypothetical protein